MAQKNTSRRGVHSNLTTYEGGQARPLSAKQQLERAIMACFLWEKTFYEEGESIAQRISSLVQKIDDVHYLQALAIEARQVHGLRHAPLYLAVEIAKKKGNDLSTVLPQIIKRADEICEFVRLYWNEGKTPLSAQIKKGLAHAFYNFDEYQLAKYNRQREVMLRDVLRLVHPKPRDTDDEQLWGRLLEGTLAPPDTWERRLSSGEDKKEVFTDLLQRNKLGGLALLRNLRNMYEAEVDKQLIKQKMHLMKTKGILPFQFIAAAKNAPYYEQYIEDAFFRSLQEGPYLEGSVAVLVDVSGSMQSSLSDKGTLTYMQAAAAVGAVVRELSSDVRVFTFSTSVMEVPARRGFGLIDVVVDSQYHGGTYLGAAVDAVNKEAKPDLLIVITDEQSHDTVGGPYKKGYMVNVSPYQFGVSYDTWTRINGWSDAVVRYIQQAELGGLRS